MLPSACARQQCGSGWHLASRGVIIVVQVHKVATATGCAAQEVVAAVDIGARRAGDAVRSAWQAGQLPPVTCCDQCASKQSQLRLAWRLVTPFGLGQQTYQQQAIQQHAAIQIMSWHPVSMLVGSSSSNRSNSSSSNRSNSSSSSSSRSRVLTWWWGLEAWSRTAGQCRHHHRLWL